MDGRGGGISHIVVLKPNFFLFFTLVTGPRRSLSLKLRDTRVYEPQIIGKARNLRPFGRGGSISHIVVLKPNTYGSPSTLNSEDSAHVGAIGLALEPLAW